MKRNIALMYAIALLQGMVFYAPVATLCRQAHGLSIFQITLIESVSLALCILLEVPWGAAADRMGYKRTMVFCCTLYFASKIVFWQADGFGWFLAERMLLSVVTAGLSGVDASILYLSCGEGESHRVFSVYSGLQTLGLLLAALVFSLWIGERYDLAGLLTVLSYGAAAALSLGLAEVRGTTPRRAGRFRTAAGQVLKDRRLMALLIAAGLLTETHQAVTVFLNQPQYQRCGMGNESIGLVYLAAALLGLTGVFSARLTRRLGERRTARLLFGLAALSCLALAGTRSAPLSVAWVLLLRVGNSLFQPLQLELQNRQITTEDRATALSVGAMVMDGVGVGANLAFGAAAELTLSAAFLLGAGLCGVGLLLFCLWGSHFSI
ncbi:MFS transporter [Intestinimonas massiliensis (ex Afouda et al. 2020)]|uniref:MFS transporter n=1 Tax=Intestinimonas massiliensis (ex Afouda et al. 2020) TaxID=1673721 RepID=UPI0010314EDF|nr:MFS transporter [Intestinimonas massiliensis (ex Afouda et al. 2020)]